MQTNKQSIEIFQNNLVDFYNEKGDNRDWRLFLDLCLKKKTAKPNKKWLKESAEVLPQLPTDEVVLLLEDTFRQVVELIQEAHQLRRDRGEIHFLNDRFQEMLKGFIWMSGLMDEESLNDGLEILGLWCFKKIPNHGALSAKLGNACLYAFSLLPFQSGIAKLTKFRMKIIYPSVRKQINKYTTAIAAQEGKTPDELEEMVVSNFGLDEKGGISLLLKPYALRLQVETVNKVSITCRKAGATLKTIPTALKELHNSELTSLRKTAKELKSYLPVQRNRIEQFYLKERKWTYANWYPLYIGHVLLQVLAKKLIWHFSKGDRKATAIFHQGDWVNAENEIVEWIGEGCTVRLWHPIGFSSDYILAWRTWLTSHEIQQPFKQAFREIYLVTDAEIATEDYSNRFAAHILRQHQFAALCKVRGWQFTLLGMWDSESIPTIHLPQWEIRAEYWVDRDWDSETLPSGVFPHIFTDQVRFYRDFEQMEMVDIPAIVFSEVMRDVDLFVGVTSIGNDPNWQDGGNEDYDDYWRDYSFADLTESSKMRKTVLENLVPRLKIANCCSFSGKYLVVRGDIRTYKIHIGSGNILMEPNDQYLCIVPNRKEEKGNKVFLPFEGDHMLSIIMSKAFLLAEDRKITDRTILSQL
ncbi:MAG: hypothetical protein ACI956_000627 [Nonlabens sp.]|jgi:hypothetical protein